MKHQAFKLALAVLLTGSTLAPSASYASSDTYRIPAADSDTAAVLSSVYAQDGSGGSESTVQQAAYGPVSVQLLAINDLHGKVDQTYPVDLNGDKVNENLGRMDYVAAYLKQREAGNPNTLILHAGDTIGGSSPVTALLQDEPTVEMLESIGFDGGTVGNHEFDEGTAEMLRMVKGGTHPSGTENYDGMNFPVVAANVEYKADGSPVLPPYFIREIGGVKIGFIGVVTQSTASIVMPGGIADIRFTDETAAVNKAAAELKAQGIRSIVVLSHMDAVQSGTSVTGAAADLAGSVDDEVDVIFAAHNHTVVNGTVDNKLIVQAWEYGKAFSDVDLQIDPATGDIVQKSAEIVYVNQAGITPDPAVGAILQKYVDRVAPTINEVVGVTSSEMTGGYGVRGPVGDNALGNFIADGMRYAMQSDFALMNGGGIRDNLNQGEVTWGELYNIQPFNNQLVKVEITGADLETILNAQLSSLYGPDYSIGGFSYTWNGSTNKVIDIFLPDGSKIDKTKTYSVTVNNFMQTATSSKYKPIGTLGKNPVYGPEDLEASVAFTRSFGAAPISYKAEGRIKEVSGVPTDPALLTVAQFRALADGTAGKAQGVITTAPLGNRSFYMQDSTGGIYVYSPSSTDTLAIGDKVTVSGIKKTFNGELEFDSGASVAKLGTEPVPAPVVVTPDQVGDQQGKLVTLKKVTVSDVRASDFNVTAGGSTVMVYTGAYGVGTSQVKQGDIIDLTGIAAYYNKNQIKPRTAADIVVTGGLSDAEVTAADAKALTLGNTTAVTLNLSLPTSGAKGSAITWSSSNPAVVGADGTVTRPEKGQPAVTAVLTATITKGTSTLTKKFTVTVPPKRLTDQEAVANAKAALFLTYDGVSEKLKLITAGADTTTISWKLTNPELSRIVDVTTGLVDRTKVVGSSEKVTLVATITRGTYSDTDVFTILVRALPAPAAVSAVSEKDTAVTGTAKAGSTVTVRIGDTVLGSAAAHATSGAFQVAIPAQPAGTVLEVIATATGYASTPAYVLVTAAVLDDAGAVAETKNALTSSLILNGNPSPDAVTTALNLPASGENGTVISWQSSQPSVIGTNGAVVRPAASADNAAVTLTATISRGSASDTLSFTVTVLKQSAPSGDTLTVSQAKALAVGTTVKVRGYLTSKTAASNSNIVFVLAEQEGVTDFTGNAGAIQIPQSNSYYTDPAAKLALLDAPVGSVIVVEGKIDTYNSKPSIESVRSAAVQGTENSAPTVTNVTYSGMPQVGATLTGLYTYSDAENDAEGASVYAWYRADAADGTGLTAIAGAAGKSYTVTEADLGKHLVFEVTPAAATGTAAGQPVKSAPTAKVTGQTGPGPVGADLIFSEYVEGTSNNKAIEIFNPSGAPIELSGYSVELYANGATAPTNKLDLSGTLAAGDVYVIANSSASAAILAAADITSTVTFFNGDDALVLKKNGVVIDVIGQVGADPGSEWGSGLTSTQDNTIRRSPGTLTGDTNASDAFDPAAGWNGYPVDTFDGLGQHTN
ncbi:immunoglobulin-like domain-containing protein [Paenibacillus caseinilyticus]|uniref:immunoglobulin-like domain-containing protein n=1 Tax=Paenibacillus caseinilyticus TaxID=3098138 RepID=UPI0029E80117|nr:immunoglobulin-like domain-containing protein [Paenibacillus caseinilyticus]